MRTLGIDGLHVEDHGGDGPALLLSHGLLWSTRMWRPQVQALGATHRVIAWDHRGQGRSAVPRDKSISVDQNSRDALTILDALELEQVRFAGLSMGGFVGMRLAAEHPDRIEKLALLCTAADPEPRRARARYTALVSAVRMLGVPPLVGQVMPVLFGESFLSSGDPLVAELRAELARNPRSITKAVTGIIARPSIEDRLALIRCPTLLLSGDEDQAIARPRMQALHAGIAGSRLVTVPRAGHTMTLENPEAVNAALSDFFA